VSGDIGNSGTGVDPNKKLLYYHIYNQRIAMIKLY